MVFRIHFPLFLFIFSNPHFLASFAPINQFQHSYGKNSYEDMLVHSSTPPYNHNIYIKAKPDFLSSNGATIAKVLVAGSVMLGVAALWSYLYSKSHQQVFQEAQNLGEYYQRKYKELLEMHFEHCNIQVIAVKKIIYTYRGTYKYIEVVEGLNEAVASLKGSVQKIKARIAHIQSDADTYRAKSEYDANSYAWLPKLEFLRAQQEKLADALGVIKSDIELLPEYEQQKQQRKNDAYRMRKEDLQREQLKFARDTNRMARELFKQQW